MPSRAPRPSWIHLPPLDQPPPTVLDWLISRFSRIDRETWVRRMEQGLVTDGEGRPLATEAPFVAHLRVGYYREVDDEPLADVEIDLIHVDEHLVVADKPAFMPVTPGGRFVRGCLLYRLEDQLGLKDLAPAHRLDRATSGLVMCVRRRDERAAYARLFAHREIERTYVALANMSEPPRDRAWRVESRIVPGSPFFRMREAEGESNAVTLVELESWQPCPGHPSGATGLGRFLLRPQTGKTHQLRIHMARLGWPILGDRLYPELSPERPDDPAAPLCLVAKRLAFRDPITGEPRVFESRLQPGVVLGLTEGATDIRSSRT